MKRFLPIAIVAVLITAGVAISLSVGGGGGSQAQESTAIVDQEVWEALEEQAEVEVYISLRKLDIPLAEQTTETRRAQAAAVQANVLSVLSSEDFKPTRQFTTIAALSGRITMSGVTLAAAHPDVIGIAVPGVGERL